MTDPYVCMELKLIHETLEQIAQSLRDLNETERSR